METVGLSSPVDAWTKFGIKKQLYTIFLGSLFSMSGQRAVVDLQTSINIQDGLGSTSGFVVYGTAILACITIGPVFVRRFGPKISIIFCDIFYLLYVLANFHPVYGTMIPGSFFSGVADGLVFPALSLCNVFYAKQYAKVSKDNRPQHHLHNFTGKCFGVVYFSKVSSNVISYLVMHIVSDGRPVTNETDSTKNESDVNIEEVLRFCGPNDCQDPDITALYLSKYVAPKVTIYVLLSVYVVLELIAIAIHVFGVKKINIEENVEKNITHDALVEVNGERKQIVKVKGNTVSEVVKVLKKCVKQLGNPYQLLLMLIQFYAGYFVGFVTAEISRAYVSCMQGVEQVGLSAAIFGTVGCISCYVNGLLAKRIGSRIPLLSAGVLDMAVYIFCLYWIPNTLTLWLVYVLCGVSGYSSGIWQTLTNAMCTKYFKKNQDVAFSVWTAFFSAGLALQFGWSIYLCVRVKIYISILTLCVALTLYGIAEILYARNERMRRRRSSAKELVMFDED